MTSEDGKLNFAILGLGNIGSRHVGHARMFGNLIAACDADASKLARNDNLPEDLLTFQSYDEMLARIHGLVDVIAVCTPNYLHCEHTVQALEAGFHVLCEKPMALTTRDCGKMINAAERNNRRLFVVKQNRYNPPVKALKAILDRGELGRILSAHLNCFWNRNEAYYESSWKGKKALDGGCLFTQFSHFVDLLYWIVGDVRDLSVYCDNFVHKDSVEFEDSGVVALRFENGALGSINFTINSFKQNMEGSLTLFCEKGTVKVGGQYLNELEYQRLEGTTIENVNVTNGANDYGTYQGSMSNHDQVYENVIDVLTNDGVIGTSGYEGLKTVEIIERIYASVRQ